MAIATAAIFPPPRPPITALSVRPPRALAPEASASASTSAAAAASVTTPPQTRRQEKRRLVEARPKALVEDEDMEPVGIAEFIKRSKEMIESGGDGGPPRWFTPLDCGGEARVEGAPLLFYLPGIDGTGLGLIQHHHQLKKIFDVWCLHIPVMDRTPFEGLLQFIERTLRLEKTHLQNKPIYLVGESFGACLAFAVAARNPDIDLMIVSANPGTSFCKSMLQSFLSFSDVIPEPLHVLVPNIFNFTGNSMRTAIAYAEKDLQQSLTMFSYLSFLADILLKESLIWKLKMLKSASLYANSRLHAVRAQTLILASGKDQLFPSEEEANRIWRIIPNCRIRHFKDSDHAVFLDSSVNLLTVIKGASFYRRSGQINYASDYFPPTTGELLKISESYRSFAAATSPVMLSTLENGKIVRGLAGIPSEGPVVFVGYHMLMGTELSPLVAELLIKKNILLRGLGHPFMFDINSERLLFDTSMFDYIRIMGAVPVTGVNFYNLLAEKQFVLLYPGGVREALHKKVSFIV